MIRTFISFLPAILFGLFLADYWNKTIADENKKEAIKQYLIHWKNKISEMDSLTLILHNFLFLSKILDRLLGIKLFSRRTTTIVFIITWFFLFVTLVLTALPNKAPFSSYAMRPTPWDIVAGAANAADLMAKDILKDPKKYKLTDESVQHTHKILVSLSHINTPVFRTGFSLLAWFGTWFLCAGLTILSLAISRRFLRELQNVKGYLTLVSSLVFNLAITVILSSIGLFILLILIIPILGLPLFGLIVISYVPSVYFGFWVTCTNFIGLWAFSSQWMKAAVMLPIFPSIMVLFSLITTVITYPFHTHIYNWIATGLVRCIEHKLGTTSFIIATLIFIFNGINFVAHLLHS